MIGNIVLFSVLPCRMHLNEYSPLLPTELVIAFYLSLASFQEQKYSKQINEL